MLQIGIASYRRRDYRHRRHADTDRLAPAVMNFPGAVVNDSFMLIRHVATATNGSS
jgi:hypothetical protein